METQLLSIDERNELERCEVVIKQGLETFIEVGQALLTIREKRLYRLEFGTFEDYCLGKWAIERRHAYRLMDASTAVLNVSHGTQIIPQSERQARPLTPLEPEIQHEVWKEVVKQSEATNTPITAAKVQEEANKWKTINDELFQLKQDPLPALSPQTLIEQAKVNRPHVSNNSGENEWYTPEQYIESARIVMGSIDLDPASSIIANKRVKANVIFTKDDSGLEKEWFGNIWMNPPYAQPLIAQFIEQLTVQKGYNQAIVLVNNGTETQWGQMLLKISNAVCFHAGRIKFIDPNGIPGAAPLQGQMICYIGKNSIAFINEFSKYGTCFQSG